MKLNKELNKERGPIYSRYDRDQSDNYKVVVDYAEPPRSREDIQFMQAHNIAPNEAGPHDVFAGSHRPSHGSAAGGATFTQAPSGPAELQINRQVIGRWRSRMCRGPARAVTPMRQRHRRGWHRSVASSWLIFILLALLMSVFGH